jgi:hypothetical protein
MRSCRSACGFGCHGRPSSALRHCCAGRDGEGYVRLGFDQEEICGMPLTTRPLPPVRARPRRCVPSPAGHATGCWLMALLVFAMVLVGGATRLTGSGLSITEWRPVTGAIPPLNAADWLSEFEKYRASPQYALLNQGMGLADFKFIYWWEWGHRQLGRFIGSGPSRRADRPGVRRGLGDQRVGSRCSCSAWACCSARRARSAGSWSPPACNPA